MLNFWSIITSCPLWVMHTRVFDWLLPNYTSVAYTESLPRLLCVDEPRKIMLLHVKGSKAHCKMQNTSCLSDLKTFALPIYESMWLNSVLQQNNIMPCLTYLNLASICRMWVATYSYSDHVKVKESNVLLEHYTICDCRIADCSIRVLQLFQLELNFFFYSLQCISCCKNFIIS